MIFNRVMIFKSSLRLLKKSIMFSDPDKNIEQFRIAEGWRVADFGAGSGAYSLAAAEMVGPDGHVYAIDINANLLSKVSSDARERNLSSLEIVAGNVEELGGSKLRDASMDAGIAANIFFQVDSKKGLVREIKRVMRSGGRVLVVDWSGSFGGIGPRTDHLVGEGEIKTLFEEAGFLYERSIDAGAHHYGFIFKKA